MWPHEEEGGQRDADLSSTSSEPWPNENTEQGGGLDRLHLTFTKMASPWLLFDQRKHPSLGAGRKRLNAGFFVIHMKVFRRSLGKKFRGRYSYCVFNKRTNPR